MCGVGRGGGLRFLRCPPACARDGDPGPVLAHSGLGAGVCPPPAPPYLYCWLPVGGGSWGGAPQKIQVGVRASSPLLAVLKCSPRAPLVKHWTCPRHGDTASPGPRSGPPPTWVGCNLLLPPLSALPPPPWVGGLVKGGWRSLQLSHATEGTQGGGDGAGGATGEAVPPLPVPLRFLYHKATVSKPLDTPDFCRFSWKGLGGGSALPTPRVGVLMP